MLSSRELYEKFVPDTIEPRDIAEMDLDELADHIAARMARRDGAVPGLTARDVAKGVQSEAMARAMDEALLRRAGTE